MRWMNYLVSTEAYTISGNSFWRTELLLSSYLETEAKVLKTGFKILFSLSYFFFIILAVMGSNTSTVTAKGGLLDAVNSRDARIVQVAIGKNIPLDETDQSGNGALHIIAKEGHYKFPPSGIPKLLIDSGIDINAKNSNGATALEISLLSGWQKVLYSRIVIFSLHSRVIFFQDHFISIQLPIFII